MTLTQPASATMTGLINVKSYGAKGDARKVTDAVCNGTTTVTSASANFTSSDVNKRVWAVDTSGNIGLANTTVLSVINSTTIVVATTAGTATGLQLVIGTDDTEALQAASAAAESMIPRGTVYLPRGGYVYSKTPFVFTGDAYNGKQVSIVGDGSSATMLHSAPDTTLDSSVIFLRCSSSGSRVLSGFTVDCAHTKFSNASVIQTNADTKMTDIRAVNCVEVAQAIWVLGGASFLRCHIENIIAGRGLNCSGVATIENSYLGNCGYYAITCTNGGTVNIFGGVLDESAPGTVYIENANMNVSMGLIYAGVNYPAVEITGSSSASISGSRLVPFASNNNCTGLKINTGATAYISQCHLTGSGTGYGLNNAGAVYAGGNNVINTTNGTAVDTSLP